MQTSVHCRSHRNAKEQACMRLPTYPRSVSAGRTVCTCHLHPGSGHTASIKRCTGTHAHRLRTRQIDREARTHARAWSAQTLAPVFASQAVQCGSEPNPRSPSLTPTRVEPQKTCSSSHNNGKWLCSLPSIESSLRDVAHTPTPVHHRHLACSAASGAAHPGASQAH